MYIIYFKNVKSLPFKVVVFSGGKDKFFFQKPIVRLCSSSTRESFEEEDKDKEEEDKDAGVRLVERRRRPVGDESTNSSSDDCASC